MKNTCTTDFETLLEEGHGEQRYQETMETSPRLIPQEFIQNHGVHLSIVLRKLSLGENYTTDFFYMSKSSGDWNLVFVEIEKPSTPYFKGRGDDLHPKFLKAIDQIDSWRAWIGAQGNLLHFLSETIAPLWIPQSMQTNPVFTKFVLVTGRRKEFKNDDRRRRLITAKERDDFKILSYDSLIDGFRNNQNVYLGVKLNSKIKILTHEFVDEKTFAWIQPERLEISQKLFDNITQERGNWMHYTGANLDEKLLDSILPRITITRE